MPLLFPRQIPTVNPHVVCMVHTCFPPSGPMISRFYLWTGTAEKRILPVFSQVFGIRNSSKASCGILPNFSVSACHTCIRPALFRISLCPSHSISLCPSHPMHVLYYHHPADSCQIPAFQSEPAIVSNIMQFNHFLAHRYGSLVIQVESRHFHENIQHAPKTRAFTILSDPFQIFRCTLLSDCCRSHSRNVQSRA